MQQLFGKAANAVAHAAGHPITFVCCCLIVIIWAIAGPFAGYSDTWQLIINTSTTIITFLMVFLIQNTQNRDTTAIQLKLDELIRANQKARNLMLCLEDLSEEDLEKVKQSFAVLAPSQGVVERVQEAAEKLEEGGENLERAASRTETTKPQSKSELEGA